MERQYIGARYVPKFFENPTTSDSAWLAGVAYEALTIVTYAGNSYTSKKPVPAGIGAPNTAPEYWAATGLYNAQIEDISNRLSTAETDIDNLQGDVTSLGNMLNTFKNKKIAIFGDSISDEAVFPPNWVTNFRNLLAGQNATITNYSISGNDLAGVYNKQLIHVPVNVQYDIIILFAGTNDFNEQKKMGSLLTDNTTDTTAGSLNLIGGWIAANQTNAEVYCITPLKSDIGEDNPNFINPLNAYRFMIGSACSEFNWVEISGIAAPGFAINVGQYKTTYSDGLHPNATYAPILAKFIMQSIICHGSHKPIMSTVKNITSFENNASGILAVTVMNDGRFTLNGAITVQPGQGYTLVTSLPPGIDYLSSLCCGLYNGNKLIPLNFEKNTETGYTDFKVYTSDIQEATGVFIMIHGQLDNGWKIGWSL